jgi:hypothetical protein
LVSFAITCRTFPSAFLGRRPTCARLDGPHLPWWGGWGGPRVVNDDVVNRTTVVNVTNITVYKNVQVHNAVVDVGGTIRPRDGQACAHRPVGTASARARARPT